MSEQTHLYLPDRVLSPRSWVGPVVAALILAVGAIASMKIWADAYAAAASQNPRYALVAGSSSRRAYVLDLQTGKTWYLQETKKYPTYVPSPRE